MAGIEIHPNSRSYILCVECEIEICVSPVHKLKQPRAKPTHNCSLTRMEIDEKSYYDCDVCCTYWEEGAVLINQCNTCAGDLLYIE